MASDSTKVRRSDTTSRMSRRFEAARKAGGGIQPGAHPEFSGPTPLDKAVAFGKDVAKKVQKFIKRSPSHVRGD